MRAHGPWADWSPSASALVLHRIRDTAPSDQSKLGEGVPMVLGAISREAAEDDPLETARPIGDLRRHGADGDTGGTIRREAVTPGRDRRISKRGEFMRRRKVERSPVAGGKKILLALAAAAPDRADRVNDVLRIETVAARDLGGAGRAAAELSAIREQLWPCRPMDRAVNPATAEQR